MSVVDGLCLQPHGQAGGSDSGESGSVVVVCDVDTAIAWSSGWANGSGKQSV